MPMLLVAAAASTEVVPALERCNWEVLPADKDSVARAVSNILDVDDYLRKYHAELVREGYDCPELADGGCIVWLAEFTGREVGKRRDTARVAEDLIQNAAFRSRKTFRCNRSNAASVIDAIIHEASLLCS